MAGTKTPVKPRTMPATSVRAGRSPRKALDGHRDERRRRRCHRRDARGQGRDRHHDEAVADEEEASPPGWRGASRVGRGGALRGGATTASDQPRQEVARARETPRRQGAHRDAGGEIGGAPRPCRPREVRGENPRVEPRASLAQRQSCVHGSQNMTRDRPPAQMQRIASDQHRRIWQGSPSPNPVLVVSDMRPVQCQVVGDERAVSREDRGRARRQVERGVLQRRGPFAERAPAQRERAGLWSRRCSPRTRSSRVEWLRRRGRNRHFVRATARTRCPCPRCAGRRLPRVSSPPDADDLIRAMSRDRGSSRSAPRSSRRSSCLRRLNAIRRGGARRRRPRRRVRGRAGPKQLRPARPSWGASASRSARTSSSPRSARQRRSPSRSER